MIYILYNALCAIKFIHKAGIIHRDIKPSNLLVDNSCNVLLCDFGLARNLPIKDKALDILHSKLYSKISDGNTEENRKSREQMFKQGISQHFHDNK